MIPASFLEQMIKLGKLLFSSPIYIGLFLIFFLLFLFQFLNVKRNNLIVKVFVSCLFLGFLLFAILGYHEAILTGLDYMIERLVLNLYFPSLAIYVIVILFSYIIFIGTTLGKRFSTVVKRINTAFFSFLQFLFSLFLIVVITNKIDISSRISMYQSSEVTILLQVSMILFVIWLLALMIAYYVKQVQKYFLYQQNK